MRLGPMDYRVQVEPEGRELKPVTLYNLRTGTAVRRLEVLDAKGDSIPVSSLAAFDPYVTTPTSRAEISGPLEFQ